jgi:hypothetical protein
VTGFGEYIAGRGGALSRRELNRIIDSYEWFTTARRARALVTGEADPALTLPLMFWPTVPPVAVQPFVTETWNASQQFTTSQSSPSAETTQTAPAMDAIDRFIEHGGYRIVPSDEAPVAALDIDIDPEMVTEELARIYLAQGLTREAEKIYRILNLDNS